MSNFESNYETLCLFRWWTTFKLENRTEILPFSFISILFALARMQNCMASGPICRDMSASTDLISNEISWTDKEGIWW